MFFYAYDIYIIARQHEPPPSKCIDEGEEEAKMTDLRFMQIIVFSVLEAPRREQGWGRNRCRKHTDYYYYLQLLSLGIK